MAEAVLAATAVAGLGLSAAQGNVQYQQQKHAQEAADQKAAEAEASAERKRLQALAADQTRVSATQFADSDYSKQLSAEAKTAAAEADKKKKDLAAASSALDDSNTFQSGWINNA